ncbi:undecaprenyldiphospho-muramoylpentapeptide beta-N-acetylglucosaminyltransferase [Sphingobacterium paramultivorum]|uniref:UDP-N-acetylglucosamine--N-acetylmuramyl-(pentapeptide) pyrophosphoryl-undecaprenol N-acetylglucosamine transferase n=1 Tax=Sphingobacterium paramultivorum TaxID=2886510 RepID=A0A7G5E4R4_9SPHI|nr:MULTISPECIES: undecaprenyldiphospho-muramoylpentapeptide beta-N-acetylglucosaminyltransferase [Sphingobacterium]QMV68989.1 undecaprenyldiphospho-muramoylpentapeptide beta-N-acetylglucosaminyltransferase [Sphingobacterium paramultivorum]WSO12765.1 undecaprenyldiphospho-muramoylpentapeptide beta-N-acetylglucosaminyltransferase [Sphingobacterium paramultivorum]
MAIRVIISGGGTGGHIFPAISIANALKAMDPANEILFVGANGRMEMDKVPAAGYKIVGLDIQGINRKQLWKNIFLPFKLMKSLNKAKSIIKDFRPDVAVGVGGFASGPLLMMANKLGVPTVVQEQNSYAGVTNKKVGAKAAKICVAYEGMEQFFPAEKVLLTGNPIRRESIAIAGKREEAVAFFELDTHKKTILVLGGSLGAKTLNESVVAYLNELKEEVQVIWQCGSFYVEKLREELTGQLPDNIKMLAFLQRMDYAYAAADLIISRAGAGTISELCVVGKPVILVPSPNVAEDHQTKNAMALVNKGAALLVKDSDAKKDLVPAALTLLKDAAHVAQLSENIKKLGKLNADVQIAEEVYKLVNKK